MSPSCHTSRAGSPRSVTACATPRIPRQPAAVRILRSTNPASASSVHAGSAMSAIGQTGPETLLNWLGGGGEEGWRRQHGPGDASVAPHMKPSRVVPRVQPGWGSESREGGTSTPLPTPARLRAKKQMGVILDLSGVRGGSLGARRTRVGHTCRTGARGTLLRHDSQPNVAGRTRISKICVRFPKSTLASPEPVWPPKCVGVFYGAARS